jgi:hypothetical protein
LNRNRQTVVKKREKDWKLYRGKRKKKDRKESNRQNRLESTAQRDDKIREQTYSREKGRKMNWEELEKRQKGMLQRE